MLEPAAASSAAPGPLRKRAARQPLAQQLTLATGIEICREAFKHIAYTAHAKEVLCQRE